jgi:hypothetical protein
MLHQAVVIFVIDQSPLTLRKRNSSHQSPFAARSTMARIIGRKVSSEA